MCETAFLDRHSSLYVQLISTNFYSHESAFGRSQASVFSHAGVFSVLPHLLQQSGVFVGPAGVRERLVHPHHSQRCADHGRVGDENWDSDEGLLFDIELGAEFLQINSLKKPLF